MAGAKLISTRLTVCVACGHESRLVASTSEEVISRCYACGDVTRTPHPILPAWSAEAGIVGNRQLTGESGPAEPRRLADEDRVAAL
jgi:pyruvate/2-oxoglutarate dehydrogenase complex dihydrolipoamide dehydrogenase (E3) component